ncbi:site-specific DNA-methyltransferase [uncultured Bacteroides sp.]|uniref:site-specific DNA-methyltransferase n=1 Tax=uncultured Bacteroides sp. TaxID=162156 RepID=UPI0026654561|nr:site-specific DNA-methyltransferase [uncultured Bacteroides sp.]
MDRLKMQSLDVIGSNIKKIQQLFPNCVTERLGKDGKPELAIDFEKLQAELSNEIIGEGEERYQFTWPDKRAANRLANTPTTMTLRPCRKESIDFDHTQNLYIEGDNLDVLKALRETYLGKVKMIYIDPPYNTGNDFVYNDDFAQSRGEFEETSGLFDEEGNQTIDPMQRNTESNGRFHTDWLNMIYPRLKVARDLLSDDGVIFISIDDNEVENLRKICDEIFGFENHIETVVWKNKYGAGAKTVGFISAHEYILVYSKKTITDLTCEFVGEEREKYNKKDSKFNQRGPYRTQPLMTNSLGDRPNLMYSIFYNGVEIKPRKQWVWSKERMEEAIANDNVEFSLQKDGSYTVRSKSYLYDENGKIRRGKPVSVMNGPFTQDGTQEVRSLFDAKSVFDFTKPSELIKFFIGLEINGNNSRDYIILDFFSGSATTAHAVMQLNAEDGGNRKFIMVQLPEKTDEKSEAYKAGYKNICEIGKERIRRAGKKIKEDNKDKDGIEKLDTGFRVLKLDSSNMEDVYYTPQEFTMQSLFNENVKADRTGEDLLFQVMLDLGIGLSAKIETQQIAGKTVYLVDDNYLIACFDRDVTEAAITEIAKLHPIYFVMRDASAANDNVIDNFEQLFEAYSKDTVRKIL